MKLCWICLIGSAAFAQNQPKSPSPAEVHLVGDRFKPLQYSEMTPEQKTLIEHVLAGERHNAGGIFNILLRSPEMGDMLQEFGAYARFHADLSPKIRELVILMTARYWSAQFEWNAHKRAGLQAGLSAEIVDAIATGKHPAGLAPEEEAVYTFFRELLVTKQVSDSSFAAVKEKFGEKAMVDMISLSGFYQISSMMLNVDRYPMPSGVQPELKPLANPLP